MGPATNLLLDWCAIYFVNQKPNLTWRVKLESDLVMLGVFSLHKWGYSL